MSGIPCRSASSAINAADSPCRPVLVAALLHPLPLATLTARELTFTAAGSGSPRPHTRPLEAGGDPRDGRYPVPAAAGGEATPEAAVGRVEGHRSPGCAARRSTWSGRDRGVASRLR